MTTRISHSKAVVELGPVGEGPNRKFVKNPDKYVMIPANARKRHVVVEERLEKLRHFTEETPFNRVENNGSDVGIITGGVAYQYCKEVAPDFDYFKIGMGYPLPFKKIEQFIKFHKRVIVIEELEPFYEDILRAAGMMVDGKKYTGTLGELSPHLVAMALKKAGLIDRVDIPEIAAEELFPRPPVLCPGCPHRGAFMALKKLGVAVTGDIGCYTLGVTEPLNAMDTCICMGASIGNAIGMEKVQGSKTGTVAVIGDSTFIHSGITGLLDAVYNKSNVTVIILNNRATAMTGGQQHPGTGKTLMGEDAPRVDLFKLCHALGVNSVRELDAYDYDSAVATIKEEMARPGPSVIITTRPCVLMPKRIMDEPYVVDLELCNGCSACFRISCPAIMASPETNRHGHPKAIIDDTLCTGCTLCAQICPTEAIILKSHFVKTGVTR
jgi:indolepyruvate ferredoxin oxidoreductase alpha subunit